AKDDEYMGAKKISSHTARLIDEEVKAITDKCYETATRVLTDNKDILEAMKDALIEFETIDSEQMEDLMARRKVRPPRGWHDSDVAGGGPDKPGATVDEKVNRGGTVNGAAKEV